MSNENEMIAPVPMPVGMGMAVHERFKQIKELGFTVEHDLSLYQPGDLSRLANYLISADSDYLPKAFPKDYVSQFFLLPRCEQLAIASALLMAEIDCRKATGKP